MCAKFNIYIYIYYIISYIVTQIIIVAFLMIIIAKFLNSVVLYLNLVRKMAFEDVYSFEDVQGCPSGSSN